MIFMILFLVISIFTIIAVLRSGKPFKIIMATIKIELFYQVLGAKALIEDFLMKGKNKTELPEKTGRYAIVTGGSRGIGAEIVKMLMQCDMHVIVGCRNVSAGEKLETLIRNTGVKSGELRCFQLDTSSIKSVKSFSQKIIENYQKIHVLVNNAGIMFGPYVETVDGFESQLAVNYLGHFMLTHLLMPLLTAAGNETENARIVNVSSTAHFAGDINLEDINMKNEYISQAAYAQSKLAQVLFTNYLQSQLNGAKCPVQVYSVHPGIVNTDLFDNTPLKNICPWLPGLIFKDPIKGATPVVCACVSSKLEGKGGTYISNCRTSPTSPVSKSKDLQEKLFLLTKDMLKIKEFGKV